ncbi:unnamed protein product [Symbiodinium sp. CCMP2592]|nr:unnamed protein product [Symbiodinium sp. CCMP2592]
MRIHYSLFKHATWHTHRKQDLEAQAADALDAFTTVCFCKAAENPAKKALENLGVLLLNLEDDSWGPAVLAFGPVLSWPQTRLRTTRRSFCVVIGQLWRKLLYPWSQFPWKLAVLVDPAETAANKESCAKKLFDVPHCCLDGFSRKLNERTADPEGLAQVDVLNFLEEVFNRVVPTSTFIERMFARLSEWSTPRKGPKPKLSSVCAKHCNHQFEQCVSLWRLNTLKVKGRNKHNRRPAWVMPANTVVNGWNLFQQDLIARNPALQNLDSVDDAASSQVPEQTGGPWNAASSHGFPLARHLIADKCHEATKVGTAFRKAHNVLQPEGADSMSGEPDPQWPLLAPCPVDACEHCLPEASRPTMSRLLDLFWKVILKQAPSLKATGSEPLVVSFHSPSTRRIHDVAVMFHTLRAPHQAALLVLHREESPELMADGILASLHASPLGRFRGQLDILSESMLLAKMATEAQDWEMRIARLGRVQLLSRFDVIGESAIDEDEYLDSRRSREQMEANAALAAFALAHPAEQPKRTSAKKPGQGPAQRPKTQAQNSLQQEKKLQGIIPFLSDSESSHAEDFGAEKAKAKAATAASLAVDEAEVWLGSGCEEVAAPEPAGNAAASSRDPATQRGTVQHRATTWGCFTIGRHTSKFFGDGWVATCGMHHNSDDKTGVVCRKVLPVQNLTEAECKLRLKRWLVAGLDEASMGGSKARSLHLAKGGPRLNHFATGLPEEELDKRVGA